MKNTICYPLAQLGYKDGYFITDQGLIYLEQSQSQLAKSKSRGYRLKLNDGRIVYRAIKPLYRLAFGREYAEDTIEDLPGEKWLPIDEKGRYYISSLGRVKSYRGIKAKILKPYYNQRGYQRVDICLETRHTYLVHQLVAQAFLVNDDPKNKDTIDHIDGNKENNSASNLRYLSRGDNVRAYQELKRKEGQKNDAIT